MKAKKHVIRYISADGLEKIDEVSPLYHLQHPTILRPLYYPLASWEHGSWRSELSITPDSIRDSREYEFYSRHETTDRIELIYREKTD